MRTLLILSILVSIAQNSLAQDEFGYNEPTEIDKNFYIKLSGSSDLSEIISSSSGDVFVYVDDNWSCNTLNLAHSKISHKKREISKNDYDSLTSTNDNTIISLDEIVNKFKGQRGECFLTQEYLQTRYFYLWIKEGDKYFEYEIYPTVARAITE